MNTLTIIHGRFIGSNDVPTPPTIEVLADVADERTRQDARWGRQDHSDMQWLAVLTEEVGEVAKCLCEMNVPGNGHSTVQHLREELIQVAAVAVAAVECIDRRLG